MSAERGGLSILIQVADQMLAETQLQQQQHASNLDDRSVPELVSPLTNTQMMMTTTKNSSSSSSSNLPHGMPPQMSLGHSASSSAGGHRTISTGGSVTGGGASSVTSLTTTSVTTMMMDTSTNTNTHLGGGGGGIEEEDGDPINTDDEEELLKVIERTQTTFPGTIMKLALDPANHEIIAFLPDGKYFCMRTRTFAQELIPRHFRTPHNIHTLEDFLDVAQDWGFRQVLSQQQEQEQEGPAVLDKNKADNDDDDAIRRPDERSSDDDKNDERTIQVFRHPLFLRGDWRRCAAIHKYPGQGHERMQRRRSSMGTTASAMSITSTTATTPPSTTKTTTTSSSSSSANKRQQTQMASSPPSQKRLSVLSGREEDAIGAMEKLCKFKEEQELLERAGGGEEYMVDTEGVDFRNDRTILTTGSNDSIRSAPVTRRNSMTTRSQRATVNAIHRHPGHQRRHSSASMSISFVDSTTNPLVEQAVKSATHKIVADAIETLMHDELHTRVTYAKHEEELSRSSLPGVIPLSKQLFQAAKTPPIPIMDSSATVAVTSEEEDSKLGASVYDTENDGAVDEDAD